MQIHDLDFQTIAHGAIVGGLTAIANTAGSASGLGRTTTVNINGTSTGSIFRLQEIRITPTSSTVTTNSRAISQGSSTAVSRSTPIINFSLKNGLTVIGSGRATSSSGGTVGS